MVFYYLCRGNNNKPGSGFGAIASPSMAVHFKPCNTNTLKKQWQQIFKPTKNNQVNRVRKRAKNLQYRAKSQSDVMISNKELPNYPWSMLACLVDSGSL